MSKPTTENMKARVNLLYRYMTLNQQPITKEQVCDICGVANERQAREILSVLAQRKPLISTSDNKGYQLAVSSKQLAEVEHTWAELSSRMEELEKRIRPLIEFRDKVKAGKIQ